MDAQRADHHVRREEILKRKGLVSGHSGPRKQNDKLSSCSYADQASASLGVDKRTVQRDLARGKKIAPEVLALADDALRSIVIIPNQRRDGLQIANRVTA